MLSVASVTNIFTRKKYELFKQCNKLNKIVQKKRLPDIILSITGKC